MPRASQTLQPRPTLLRLPLPLRATLKPPLYPAVGLPELREAIAAKTLADSGTAVSASQVIVTNGGKQAVYQAFATLVDEGDEVLLPAPYWTTYPEAIALLAERPLRFCWRRPRLQSYGSPAGGSPH